MVIARTGWSTVLDHPSSGVLIAVPEVQSAFHHRELLPWTGATADEATMRQIDSALAELFGL